MVKKVLTFVMGLMLAISASATINFSASDIQFWVGTGSNSAVVVIAWDDYTTPTAYAWGVHWNGTASALDLVDSIQAYDSRFHNGSTATVASATYTENGVTLTSDDDYWCYTVNGQFATVGYTGYTMSNGDIMEISGSCMFTMTTATAATDPNADSTPTNATIAFSDILYWVGTGSNEAVLAVNWADTALAWGYRWTDSATVADMMDAIAAADPRFSYSGTGWLNDIMFNDGTVNLAGVPGSYWESTNNGVMDAGMGQTLVNGDFEKWGEPAAGVVVDSMEYGGTWYYTYVYPMTVHPVSVPTAAPDTVVEATIAFSDILYWVGTGSNEAVLAVNWADTALAWGYRWTDSATVADMMDAIAAADPRFSYTGTGMLNDILFNDGTVNLAITPGNWWGSTNNGFMDMGLGQSLADGDLEKWGDPAAGVIVDSMEWGGVYYYTYAYPMTIYPVSIPPATPDTVVEATIDASAIEYWIGEGESQAILAVNWPDTALAWGYRFTGSKTVSDMMNDIAAADPRFSIVPGSYGIDDILFVENGDTLRRLPDSYWGSTNNGVIDMGMSQPLANNDFEKWSESSTGVFVDSTWVDEWGGYWSYNYVYPMTIHAASQPLGAGPFCGIVGTEGCTAIPANSTAIKGWATACTVELGPQNISIEGSPLVSYRNAQEAVGPCTMNDNLSVVALGDGGSATVTFEHPIMNGDGPDFAVFENSFDDYFLELAFVEVSSDGVRFVRFPATSLTQTVHQVVSRVDASFINNLAGKYKMGYGTPFDLEELRDSAGIDINNITHVRVVDVVGSINPQYATYDAFGHMVNDPWPTNSHSSGFDLDGVAVLNQNLNGIENADIEVSIYPNPVANVMNISLANAAEARLMDINGRTVATFTLSAGSNSLNIASLPAGVYMLNVDGNVKKIVKL